MLDELFQRMIAAVEPQVTQRLTEKEEEEANDSFLSSCEVFDHLFSQLSDRFFADVFLKYVHSSTARTSLLNHYASIFGDSPLFRIQYRHFSKKQQQLFQTHAQQLFLAYKPTLNDSFQFFFNLHTKPKSQRLQYLTGTKRTHNVDHTLDNYTFLSTTEADEIFHLYRLLAYQGFLFYLERDECTHLANALPHALELLSNPVVSKQRIGSQSVTTIFQDHLFSYGDLLAEPSLRNMYDQLDVFASVQHQLKTWYQDFRQSNPCLVCLPSSFDANLYQLENFIDLSYLLEESERQQEKETYLSFLSHHLQDIQRDEFANDDEREQYYFYVTYLYSLYQRL